MEGGEVDLIGVDRGGQDAAAPVVFKKHSIRERDVFIGTTRSAGIFSPRTMISDLWGRRYSANELANQDFSEEVLFESVTHSPQCKIGKPGLDSLWSGLRNEAALWSTAEVFVRFRRKPSDSFTPVLGERKSFSKREYYVLEKVRIGTEPENLVQAIRELLVVFENESDISELGRDSVIVVLSGIAALTSVGEARALVYDSMQHSTTIGIAPISQERRAVGGLRCSFRMPSESDLVEILWSANQWKPVCNGFVLDRFESTTT